MTDILERLKQTTKINGAYPRDIADAIKEIEDLRQEIARLLAKNKARLKASQYLGSNSRHGGTPYEDI